MECLFLLHDEVGAKNPTALMTAELSAVYYFLLCLFIKSRGFCFCMPLSTVKANIFNSLGGVYSGENSADTLQRTADTVKPCHKR